MDTTRPPADGGPDTGPDGLAVPGDDGLERRDPSEIRDPLPQPLVSRRRLVILALLIVAAGCVVVAARSGGGGDATEARPAIASFSPAPGGRVVRQSTVGVILDNGYDGRLTINGVAIPEVQMEGAIDPDSEAWRQLTPEQQEQGPRPNAKERVLFRPGPGKAITEFDTGEVQITVRYWDLSEGEATARSFSYSIYTT